MDEIPGLFYAKTAKVPELDRGGVIVGEDGPVYILEADGALQKICRCPKNIELSYLSESASVVSDLVPWHSNVR
jgi:hypothetical protein